MEIKDFKIVEKVFKRDIWFVVLDNPYNGRKTMPYCHYVWLKGNPIFHVIPTGYVIHHLDHDKQNDDISNLVLMQKHHHVAHHWKQKIINSDVPVKIDCSPSNRIAFFPLTRPRIYPLKSGNAFFVQVWEETAKGKRPTKVYRHNGEKFKTEEDAEKFVALIWHPADGLVSG